MVIVIDIMFCIICVVTLVLMFLYNCPAFFLDLFEWFTTQVLQSFICTHFILIPLFQVGDVVVTVEHCCDCCDHDWVTHHDEQQYEDVSRVCGVLLFVMLSVVLHLDMM